GTAPAPPHRGARRRLHPPRSRHHRGTNPGRDRRMIGNGLFITGTDTGVGKTWVTTRLIQKLRATGVDAVGMKPVECGGREDSRAIFEASGGTAAGLTLEMVNPVSLPEPLAPAAAAIPHHIDFGEIRSAYETLANRHEFV